MVRGLSRGCARPARLRVLLEVPPALRCVPVLFLPVSLLLHVVLLVLVPESLQRPLALASLGLANPGRVAVLTTEL